MPRPNGRDPQSDPAAFLGTQLRRLRAAAGYASQDSFATALGFDRSTVTKAETGSRPPTDDVFGAWLELCNASAEGRDILSGLLLVARRTDGPVPAWFEDYLEAEREAHTLRIWQPLIVPGPLQTADYARALFIKARHDPGKVEEMVAARLERQKVFERPNPPHTVVVLDEPVLHHLIGSPAVMRDQMVHLGEMTETLQVQVVPASRGGNAGLSGGFTIASCDGAPDILRMEAVEDMTEERRPLVRHAALIFDLVRGDALACDDSRTQIVEAADLWKSR